MIEITDWSETFENADTRKRQRLGWFLAQSGCDSKGYRRLMKKGAGGVIAFGVFQALCQLTATSTAGNRGTFLHSNGKMMDIEDLADLTRMPEEVIDTALHVLADVGWIQFLCGSQPVDHETTGRNLPPAADPLPVAAGFVKGEGEGEGTGEGEDIRSSADAPDQPPVDPVPVKVETGPDPELARIERDSMQDIWAIYPRKIAKKKAMPLIRQAYRKVGKPNLIAALTKQVETWEEEGKLGTNLIPHPATWFGQGRWEDDMTPTVEKVPTDHRKKREDTKANRSHGTMSEERAKELHEQHRTRTYKKK